MKVFVTGATGFIGSKLVERLAEEGHEVHALYRSEKKLPSTVPRNVIFFKGDITDPESLKKAMQGCEVVFHVAAFAGIWLRDTEVIYRLNVTSAVGLLQMASVMGVRRCVVTSSAAVFGPSRGALVDESTPFPETYCTHYEHSKAILEKEIDRLLAGGHDIVVVNPTRVYGPGPLNESNSVTKLVMDYTRGKWRLLPGNGEGTGNYVFIDDVTRGHLLAMEKGRTGERYILGGENVSYTKLFDLAGELNGKKYRMMKMPLWLMMAVAWLTTGMTRMFGAKPFITPGLVRKYHCHWMNSSVKAMRELGYNPVSLAEGLQHTIRWIKTQR